MGLNTVIIRRYLFRLYVIGFLVSGFTYPGLKGQCKPQVWSFKSGEILNYNIVYNWGFIWVDAGLVEFKALKEKFGEKDVYHFSGTGTSLKKHDWFFKVRDYYNSWADYNDLKPLRYTRNTTEGKYQVKNNYWFNHYSKKIFTDTWNSKKKQSYDTIPMTDCLFDIMTAVYYARTLDFNNFSLNEKIPISMIVDNEIYNLYGRFLGKETISLHGDKNKINCLKFSMLLVEGTMFKGGEDLLIWVSDDENRVPILVEAKILVGSVKALFNGAVNLKTPVSYKTGIN